jgi:hypothetical protein
LLSDESADHEPISPERNGFGIAAASRNTRLQAALALRTSSEWPRDLHREV